MTNKPAPVAPEQTMPLTRGLREIQAERAARHDATATAVKIVAALAALWCISFVLDYEVGPESPVLSAWINYCRLAVSAAAAVRLAMLSRASGFAAAAVVLCLGTALCAVLSRFGAAHDVVVYFGAGTLTLSFVVYTFTVR